MSHKEIPGHVLRHLFYLLLAALNKFIIKSLQIPLDRLPTSLGELLALLVRCIRVVHVVLRSPPERSDHFVQHKALLGVTEDVLAESIDATTALLPQSLEAGRFGSDPNAPVEALESLKHSFHGFSLASAH